MPGDSRKAPRGTQGLSGIPPGLLPGLPGTLPKPFRGLEVFILSGLQNELSHGLPKDLPLGKPTWAPEMALTRPSQSPKDVNFLSNTPGPLGMRHKDSQG